MNRSKYTQTQMQTVTVLILEGKYSLESTDSRESEIRAPPQLTIALKLSLFIIAKLFKVKDGCLKFVYNIKISGLRRRHRKTLTYLRRAYVSVYRYSLEVFPVSRTGKTMTNKLTFFG